MEPNIFFGKFIVGNITRLYSAYYAKKICGECEPFIKTGATILDLGCGRGDVTSALQKHFNAKIVGVDIQDTRMMYDFPFHLIDGEYLPFDDKSFDVVFIRYVLHHCPNSVPLLTEAKRVARGKIIIYEDLPEGTFSKFFCRLHGLSFNFFLQPKFKKCSFNNGAGWEQIFNESGLRVIHKKRFFSEAGPFYPVQKILFVLGEE